MALKGEFTSSTANQDISAMVSWSATQNIDENYSTVKATLYYVRTNETYTAYGNWNGSITINGTTIGDSKRITIASNGYIPVMSATVKVPHNIDGTKSCTISAGGYISDISFQHTMSKTVELDTIPRQATITTAPDFNDEENPTITYNNVVGASAETLQTCISLDGSKDDVAYRDIGKNDSSYTFNLTDAERKVLRTATTSNSRTVIFYVKTVLSGQTYYSSVAKTYTIVNGNPIISPTVIDSNATTITLTGNNQSLVRYFSDAQYTIGARAIKEATLSSQKVVCGGKSATTASGTLNAIESGDFVFTATDSRGNTTTQTVSKPIINYIKLTCNCEPSIPTAEGEMTLTIKGNYFNGNFGAQSNTLTLVYRMKVNNGEYGEWQTATASLSSNTYNYSIDIAGLDYQTTYTFQAQAIDKLMNVVSAEKSVKSTPVFDWGKDDFRFNVPVYFSAGFSKEIKVLLNGTGTLASPVSAQDNGIVLVFSLYSNGAPVDKSVSTFFVSKKVVELMPSAEYSFLLSADSVKYLTISNTKITDNTTDSGFVLRYVLGV